MSERWVAPTNVELEKGGAKEGGAIEMRFACGGTVEYGSTFWRKERAESHVWGNGRVVYWDLEKFYFAFMFVFLVLENFFFCVYGFFKKYCANVENCGSFRGFSFI